MLEPLWTIKDVAKYLQMSENSVRVALREKGLPYLKANEFYRFEREAVEEWMESQMQEDFYGDNE